MSDLRDEVSKPTRVIANDVLKPIGHALFRGKRLSIERDHNSKFWVKMDGFVKQRRLTSEEVVRYLLQLLDGR